MTPETVNTIEVVGHYLEIIIWFTYTIPLCYILCKFTGRCKFDQTALTVLFLQEFAFLAFLYVAIISLFVKVYDTKYYQAGYVIYNIAYGMLTFGIYLLVFEMHRVK